MICKFCGNVIEDNSDFCFICGQKVVTDAPAYAAEVYSQQPQGAPAQPVYSAAPEVPVAPQQPVYAAPGQPVYAVPGQPVYAAPVAPEAPQGKKAKKAKKVKKEKAPVNPAALSTVQKVFIGLIPALLLAVAGVMCQKFIIAAVFVVLTLVAGFVLYKQYKKALDGGYEEKALDILNTGMIGLCVGMAVVVIFLFINFVIK